MGTDVYAGDTRYTIQYNTTRRGEPISIVDHRGVAALPKGYARHDRCTSASSRVTPSLDTTETRLKFSRRTDSATPLAKYLPNVSQEATVQTLRQQFEKRGFGFATLLAVQLSTHGVDHARDTVLLGFHNAVVDAQEELARRGAFAVTWASLQATPHIADAPEFGLPCNRSTMPNVAQYGLCLIF
jgi:hypothetical protein